MEKAKCSTLGQNVFLLNFVLQAVPLKYYDLGHRGGMIFFQCFLPHCVREIV